MTDTAGTPNSGDAPASAPEEPPQVSAPPGAVSEKELIEAAARAAPAAKGTTTDRAMNIIQASVIQREAITKAYEAQKKSINDAVKEQRVSAMQQMTTARNQFTERDAIEKMQQAQSATRNLVSGGENASATTPAAPNVPPQATQAPPAPQGPPSAPQQGTPPQQVAPQAAPPNPAQNPDLAPEAPIANELANTIRAIISEEVNKQLKELLAIHAAQTEAAQQTSDETS